MMMGNLLVLDYDENQSKDIAEYFLDSGYEVICSTQTEETLQILKTSKSKINLLIYKLNTKSRGCFEILDKIRAFSDLPIIVISEDARLESQLYAYSKKIDDYMVEPVLLPLLEAHLEAILKRSVEKNVYEEQIGNLSIDYESRKVHVSGKVVKLTTKEFDLLEFFIRHRGMVLSRDKILDSVWGYDYIGGYRSVDTLVKKLRAKLSKDFPYIKTIYGVGYCFDI